ncbi:MAG: bifunctional aldolase/short-chain dehydrogenase [Planctomycetes bacterium]|nr:bifunctional aldolase/short-chain dehydrogenase [Planctomycetota bacterium]
MDNAWNDVEAAAYIDRYAPRANEDVALRVYTSHLIGRDPSLVLHGGGNTSVKTTLPDRIDGTPIEVLCVKGSGSDLADLGPRDLPALQLGALRRLRGVPRLGDEEMVNQVRTRLLDASSPTPSVETLLHAFLPHKFVDHTHADAIVVLTNQPDGERRVRDALGERVPVLPWIPPGHPLAEAVADAYERAPDCEGIVLIHHGIFTFGATAKDSYDRMIELCSRAERALAAGPGARPAMLVVEPGRDDEQAARRRAAAVLPRVRGAVALRRGSGAEPVRAIADLRCAPDLVAFSRHADARRLCATGPLTPDHVIRTKEHYLYLAADEVATAGRVQAAVEAFEADYVRGFQAHRERVGGELTMLDPQPRVAVIEGVGLIGFGGDAKAARIAADIAEHTVRGKALGEAIGSYRALPRPELLEMEYWPLELAKLGRKVPPPLAGRIALVTGAAGAIGHGIADELLAAGAHVAVTDVDPERLAHVRQKLAARHGAARVLAVRLDVTDSASVREAFDTCVLRFGGLDVLVPNAGVAHVSKLRDMSDEAFERVVSVNLDGTMRVLREAARVFEEQGTGGSVVLQASKNVFAPGAGFGAYSASKAGALQLARIAALELAPLGVRVNSINADAVFGDDDVPSGLWAEVGPDRMRARGLDPQGLRAYYRDRSLLKTAVLPRHVGEAVVFFASGRLPTTGAVLPVDGGLPEAFPR